MTYNEFKKFYKGYKLLTCKEDWLKIYKTKGNCIVIDCNADDYDKEVYFNVI